MGLLAGLFRIDAEAHRAARPVSDNLLVQAIGWLSDVGDQPQLWTLSWGVLAAGAVRRDARLAGAGARMLAAHFVATKVKSAIKHRVDRTRPRSIAGSGAARPKKGGSHAKEQSSFPSGHSAGALAVALAYGRAYPRHRAAALTGAGAVALAQIPRCAHYPTDVGAGLLIGWASEWMVDRAVRRLSPSPSGEGSGWGMSGVAAGSAGILGQPAPHQPLIR